MAVDWAAIRVEYVNGAMSFKDLADKHKLKEGTVRQRGNRESWAESRNELSRAVTHAAQESIAKDRVGELEKFNADDLKMARAIRARAAQMMANTTTPQDLSALARAVDTAQRVGRLALGATTENNGVTGSINTTSVTPQELAAAVERVRATY